MTSPKPAARPGSGPGPAGSGPSPTLLALVAGAFAILLHLPALQFGYVWDDAGLVTSQGRGGLMAQGFRPVAAALSRVQWIAGLGSPAFYHFASVVLHGVATWLFFHLARGAGAAPAIALGAALLFAAHPVHVEAIAYASAQPDLLATVFALGALALARSAPVCGPGGCRNWRVWPAYALLALAVLSDEVALVTPLLLIGLDRWGEPRVPVRGRTTVYAGFAAVALAGLLARIGAGALRFPAPHESVSPSAGFWAAPIAFLEYMKALAVPFPLQAMRSLSEEQAASGALHLGAVAAAVILVLFVLARRRDPLARVGALFLVLPMIPALPISPFEVSYAEDRAAYFASTGFCLLAGSLYKAAASVARSPRLVPAVAGVVVALAAAAGTWARLPVWRNNVALLADAARWDPADPAPHLVVAEEYFARGDLNGALGAVERALVADPSNVEALQKQSVLLSRLGRYPEGEAAARRTVELAPGDAVSWSNLGDLLTRQDKHREAADACRRAVELDPKNPDNWYNYGVALSSLDSLPAAMDAYHRAITINPRHVEAINNLGALQGALGRIQEARDTYLRAVEIAPTSVQARMNLALAYLRLGDRDGLARERAAIQMLDRAAAAQLTQMIEQAGGARPLGGAGAR